MIWIVIEDGGDRYEVEAEDYQEASERAINVLGIDRIDIIDIHQKEDK